MSVTIYDIANGAGVSIATVSRVFNDHPRVSAPTRQRVLEVARRLNYQPNVSARSLARQTSHLISAVIPVMTSYFYMEVLRGMQEALRETEFDLLVYSAPSPEEIDGQLDRAIQRNRSEGLLLLSTPLSEERTEKLKAARQIVALVDATHPDFDSVSVDNTLGGYLATRHLLELGYRRIGLITVSPEPPPAVQRRAGYEQALREAGVAPDRALVASIERRPYGFCEESGYEALHAFLRGPVMPEAVFAVTDVQAYGALHAAQEAGLRVPEDLAVIGFDDIKISEYVGLTTLRQPMYEMGRLAVEKLLLRIQHPNYPVTQTVFSPRLVKRATSGCSGSGFRLPAVWGRSEQEVVGA